MADSRSPWPRWRPRGSLSLAMNNNRRPPLPVWRSMLFVPVTVARFVETAADMTLALVRAVPNVV